MTLVLNGTTGVSSVDGSASTPAIQGNDSNTGVFFPAADTVAIATGGTERARVDSAGNLGIGTSSPAWKLDVNGIVTSRSDSLSGMRFQTSANGYNGFVLYETSSNSMILNNYNAGPITFKTNDTERARIDSSGNLLVGTTSNPSSGKVAISYARGTTAGMRIQDTVGSGGTGVIADFYNSSGTSVGAITHNSSNTTYGTSSDYRLKENVQPMVGALDRVAALKPCTYTWKATQLTGEGFIAHELAEVVPDAVVGEKDAVNEDGSIKPQSIDTSFLVATLTAAIQEQQALIESLTARIAALEAK